jgi:CubicO group peptidase (beta-lactamase class C family)
MKIRGFVEAVGRQGLKVEGILLLQGGEKIAEYRWVPEAPRLVYSVSKSFAAIAVGMAIGEGKLSLRDRVIDAFPEFAFPAASPSPEGGPLPGEGPPALQGDRLASLTLEHCLTMTRGHPKFTRPRRVGEALAQELAWDPGTRFCYDNGCTLLASAMLTRATGQKLRDYLLNRLFEPLEILDPPWDESDDGYTIAATGLHLTTTETAAFGQFLLQRGLWKGKQLVSPAWIDGATRAQVSTGGSRRPDCDLGYGYGFWTCRHGAYRCDGRDGQFVVVIPGKEAVAAINSSEENMMPILYTLWDQVLPLL